MDRFKCSFVIYVYITTMVLVIIAVFGVVQLQTTGKIVDDIPRKDELYRDLQFLQENFDGVMPLEFSIDTKKRKGIQKLSTINKIEELEQVLATYPELSKTISIAEVLKFSKQAFYGGNEKMYSLPNNNEKNFILRYLPSGKPGQRTILNSFIDTNMRYTRISTQMANVGTYDIQRIKDELRPKIDSIYRNQCCISERDTISCKEPVYEFVARPCCDHHINGTAFHLHTDDHHFAGAEYHSFVYDGSHDGLFRHTDQTIYCFDI